MGPEPHSILSPLALYALSHAASTDSTRGYLRGVHVQVAKRATIYAATDGHILAALREPLRDRTSATSLGDCDNEVLGAWIIPSAVCKNADRRGTARLTMAGESMRLAGLTKSEIFEPVCGIFPEWTRIVPRVDASDPLLRFDGDLNLNVNLLIRAQRIYSTLTPRAKDSNASPVIYPTGASSGKAKEGSGPAVLRWRNAPDLFLIVMPQQCPREPLVTPAWASPYAVLD